MIDLMTFALIKKYCKQLSQTIDTKADSLQKQIDALVNGMIIIGESSTDPSIEGATVSGVKKYRRGNVVLYNSCEYVLVGDSNNPDNWIQLGDDNHLFNKLSEDSNIWELSGDYVLDKDVNISLQTGSQVLITKGSQLNATVNDKVHYFIVDVSGKIYYGTVGIDGTPEENGNALIELNKTVLFDNDIEYEVKNDYNPAHKKYVDEAVESGISDLYFNLDKNINPEDSTKTIINVQNKSGGTSVVVEVDNIDIVSSIPQHQVLGAVKGKDIENRLVAIEKNPLSVIELSADITEEDMKVNHSLPVLKLSKEQIQKILNTDVTILKVKFNVQKSQGTEIDTLVFYTTIDSIEGSNSGITANTIKINAIRTNDEGTIVYHAELLGNGEQFAASIDLTPKWIPHSNV